MARGTHRRRTAGRITASGALAMCMAAGMLTAPASAADESHALIDGLPSSDELTTDVVAEGVVDDARGRPLPGAAVVLFAWPSAEVESATAVGETITLEPVAQDVTDRAGGYALRIDAVDRLLPSASEDGIVNFELRVFSDDGTASWHFPRAVEQGAGRGALRSVERGADGRRAPAAVEVLDLRTDRAALSPRGRRDGEAVDKHDCSASGGTKVASYGQRWVTVGATYSATTGVTHDFVYDDGASSSLGVGVSASGSYGSFSSRGSLGRSSTTTISFPAAGDNTGRSYRTTFDYNKWKVTCGSYFYGTQHTEYQVRAGTFGAGRDYVGVTIPSTPSQYCSAQRVKGAVTKSSSSAVTWTNGAKLGGAIGVDLSSQTGYSSTSKVVFTFNAAPRRLCGTNDLPGGTPRRLVARSA